MKKQKQKTKQKQKQTNKQTNKKKHVWAYGSGEATTKM